MTPDTESKSDHRAILDELRRLREDFKEVVVVTRQEQQNHRDEITREFETIRTTIKEMTGLIHRVDKTSEKAVLISEDNKKLIWTIGGSAITVSCVAVAKALGFY